MGRLLIPEEAQSRLLLAVAAATWHATVGHFDLMMLAPTLLIKCKNALSL